MSRRWSRYAHTLQRWRWFLLGAGLALAAGLGLIVKDLSVQTDFKRLLPQHFRSVSELEKIESRVRSTATLLLLVGGEDWPAMRRFIDDFVAQVPDQLGDLIDRVEYNGKTIGRFFERHKYLYLDYEDLQTIYERLKRQLDYEKIRRSPLYIDLGEDQHFDVSDIEAKYKGQISKYGQYRDGYFTNANASLAIVVLKPRSGATNIGYARELIGRAQAIVDRLQPKTYHASLMVGFGGRYPKLIQEYETIMGDMLVTIVLCCSLVSTIVLLYFRRLRMGAIMLCTAGLGTVAALAVARGTIGYLTAQTAFLGSIILGNGINYSLILMARYMEERREQGRGAVDGIAVALSQTWRATLASALTTAASFAALAAAEIRGFSQFGFIGGVGMLLCWLLTYSFTPAWLLWTESLWPLRFSAHSHQPFSLLMRPLGRWIVRHFITMLKITVAAIGIATLIIGWYLPNALEYDFEKLRFRTSEEYVTTLPTIDLRQLQGAPEERHHIWQRWAQNRSDEVFGESASPAIILADRPDQVPLICAAIRAKGAHLYTEDGKRILDECKSLLTYVPTQQAEKLALLRKFRALLADTPLDFLTPEQRQEVELLQATMDLQPIGREDLPETIVDNFREADGREGLVIYVYPRPDANLWHGRELVKFSSLVRKMQLANGETIYASGEATIFADLLSVITRQGPLISLLSLSMVILLVALTFRERRATVVVVSTLLLGILWMIALLPLFRVKLNFLNFVAFPIAFGIGVDYAVNIYQRYVQDGPGSIESVVRHVGGAILLCSLTTIFGYSVLLISRNGALASFGLAGLLAEIACLLAALLILPAYITWQEHEKALAKNE